MKKVLILSWLRPRLEFKVTQKKGRVKLQVWQLMKNMSKSLYHNLSIWLRENNIEKHLAIVLFVLKIDFEIIRTETLWFRMFFKDKIKFKVKYLSLNLELKNQTFLSDKKSNYYLCWNTSNPILCKIILAGKVFINKWI